MKESGEDRLKCAINESTLSTADAVPLPRWGRLRGGGSAAFIRRSSQVRRLREYPIHRWRGPPSPMGKAKRRRLRRKKESQPRLAAPLAPSKGRGSRGHSLLPLEGGAPKGRRLDGDAAIPRCDL